MATTPLEIKGLDALHSKLNGLKLKSIEARVGNNTEYGPLVGSKQFQAEAHKGRWTTDEQAIELERDAIEKDFQEAVNGAINSSNPIARNPLLVAADAAVKRLQTRMATYPPPPSGSTCQRTGTYGRRWTVEVKEVNG